MNVNQNYSYSLDKESRLVNAKDAIKGMGYSCPCCGEIMIPKQGKIRRWHFAHKSNPDNCSYETYLHKIAKKLICDCFNKSDCFKISYQIKAVCDVEKCPLGSTDRCRWDTKKEFNLKELYNKAEEEVAIDQCRADILISNTIEKLAPILIEIWVSHKSTDEKLNLNNRIIEIKIESEEDIEEIVSKMTIDEGEKIRFYNFKREYGDTPGPLNQQDKYLFWIDRKMFYRFNFKRDNIEGTRVHVKCLENNPPEIEHSRFRIESKEPIDSDFAFCKLSESGQGIKYCNMCIWLKYSYGGSICKNHKYKGTPMFPMFTHAMECPNYMSKVYHVDEQECKIVIQ